MFPRRLLLRQYHNIPIHLSSTMILCFPSYAIEPTFRGLWKHFLCVFLRLFSSIHISISTSPDKNNREKATLTTFTAASSFTRWFSTIFTELRRFTTLKWSRETRERACVCLWMKSSSSWMSSFFKGGFHCWSRSWENVNNFLEPTRDIKIKREKQQKFYDFKDFILGEWVYDEDNIDFLHMEMNLGGGERGMSFVVAHERVENSI